MALTNAERQRRFRERLRARAASSVTVATPPSLYALAAELPDDDIEVNGVAVAAPRPNALDSLEEMRREAVTLYETFAMAGHERGAAAVATIFALRTDLASLTYGAVLNALAAAKIPKAELRKLIGSVPADDIARGVWERQRDWTIDLSGAYSLRSLLERLGLW